MRLRLPNPQVTPKHCHASRVQRGGEGGQRRHDVAPIVSVLARWYSGGWALALERCALSGTLSRRVPGVEVCRIEVRVPFHVCNEHAFDVFCRHQLLRRPGMRNAKCGMWNAECTTFNVNVQGGREMMLDHLSQTAVGGAQVCKRGWLRPCTRSVWMRACAGVAAGARGGRCTVRAMLCRQTWLGSRWPPRKHTPPS